VGSLLPPTKGGGSRGPPRSAAPRGRSWSCARQWGLSEAARGRRRAGGTTPFAAAQVLSAPHRPFGSVKAMMRRGLLRVARASWSQGAAGGARSLVPGGSRRRRVVARRERIGESGSGTRIWLLARPGDGPGRRRCLQPGSQGLPPRPRDRSPQQRPANGGASAREQGTQRGNCQ
jgi:hypothetical protein